MAGGLLGFLGFGKKEKPNLTQNYQAPPAATSSPMWGTLSDFATKRINGQGTGYGEDYLSKTANPAIAQIDANFKNRTMPLIDSQLSKRGVARSAGAGLATDVIGQADLQRNRDIDSLMANFYQLNEAQKKTDEQTGINVGENLQKDYLNQGNQAASQFNAAEAGNTARTANVAATNNASSLARQNNVLNAAGSGVSMLGGTETVQNLLDRLNLGKAARNPVSANILGNDSGTDQIDQLLALYGI